jgi:hypothetical protein
MLEDNRVSDATDSSVVQESEKSQEKEKKDTVSYDTYKRTLSQLKKKDEQLKGYEERLLAIEQAEREREQTKRQAEEQRLQEKGEFKKLLELERKRNEDLLGQLEGVSQEKMQAQRTIQDTVKLHAFYEKLPGKVKRREYLNFVDLENIVVNPETQEIDSSSVDGVVNSFMDNYSELVDTSHMGKLPAGNPGNYKAMDMENWKKLSSKEMKKTYNEMLQKRMQSK